MPRIPKSEPYFLAHVAILFGIAVLFALGVGLFLHRLDEILRTLVP